MWNLIPKKSMPPTRIARYCCAYLKEGAGSTRFVITGIRWAESPRRKQKRSGLELSNHKGQSIKYDPDEVIDTTPYKYRVLNPIIDWEESEVWEFIKSNDVPYCSLYDEGFERLGCVGCPMAGKKKMLMEFDRWPKYKKMYWRALEKTVPYKTDEKFKDMDTYWDWWINLNQ